MLLRDWVGLAHWYGMKVKTIQEILPALGSLGELFRVSVTELISLGVKESVAQNRALIDWKEIDADLAWAALPNRYIFSFMDEGYPPLLREIASPPLVLYIYGNLEVLSIPSLAIVGSRKPTALGKETAFAFAQAATRIGLSVCSGLAYGIDAAAHRGVLEVKGSTLAVLGSGLDRIYPHAHKPLSEQILKDGCLISEFSPQTSPQSKHFPRRNRIISGLSAGVLVIEAAAKSGSLITARYALEQGKEVFAVPGSIYNSQSRGCHWLIRQGATLVESIQDIMEEIGATVDICGNNRQDVRQLVGDNEAKKANLGLLSLEQQELWHFLDDAPSHLDALAARSAWPLNQLRRCLVHLELLGYARAVRGGYQRCWPSVDSG